ncbi:hypothetical protein ASPZODRAFT_132045 [Penicilliopsis zonata CBS 506.65]|uniref:Uncharacterized protein n=1 Tax=Penicilliopsis zonata CBS 506.65 TaxID=1073090 RepID=A0A1L9SJ87_9EURO|nr:hypothetical protein ASPZODRAFT_132045 [Penicilliopsis zonata CBS 506.65]OJJ47104.1 hypothetical protein ASPZODRAFT_132045 [Penicilliopsis zonata CBS 506.65]
MVYVGPSTGCYLCRKRKIKVLKMLSPPVLLRYEDGLIILTVVTLVFRREARLQELQDLRG